MTVHDEIKDALRLFAQTLSKLLRDLKQASGLTTTISQPGDEHGQAQIK
jgi:hypothetical protein